MKRIRILIAAVVPFLVLTLATAAYADDLTNGGTYFISNDASGKVLDVYGDTVSSTAKSNVQVYTKSSGADNYSQQFTVKQSSGGWFSIIPKSNSSLAVNPYADAPKDGTNVNVYALDASDKSQGWYFDKNGASYIIRNAYNKNIVLAAAGTGDKANVQVAAYNASSKYQLWTLTSTASVVLDAAAQAAGEASEVTAAAAAADQAAQTAAEAAASAASAQEDKIQSGKIYLFTNQGAGRVLDVKGDENKSKNKANVQLYKKSGTGGNRSQQFKVTKTKKGWYSITVVNNSSLALNAFADKPKNKTNVNIYKKNTGDKTQGWYLEKTSKGYVIRNAYKKKLVLAAVSSKNGANVRVETYNGSKYQFWKLTQVTEAKSSSSGSTSAGKNTSSGSTSTAKTETGSGTSSGSSSGSAAGSEAAPNGKQVISNKKLKDIVKKVGTQEGHSSWKSMCAAVCVAYVRYWRTGEIKTAQQMGGTNAVWGRIGTKAVSKNYKGKDSALFAKIRERLNKGKVCILHVHSSAGQHWVVVYGYTGKGASQKELLVLDPWDGKFKSLTKMIYRLHSDRRLIYY